MAFASFRCCPADYCDEGGQGLVAERQIPSRDQDATTVHGTQKPVEVMRRPVLNNSSPGQAVY